MRERLQIWIFALRVVVVGMFALWFILAEVFHQNISMPLWIVFVVIVFSCIAVQGALSNKRRKLQHKGGLP
ncbi:hypothetical protein IV500_05535 [Paeniglutamicibacter antarcticus]|uniref:Uncharacterized protein n=1 Tax=Arthrobacter terrae TaxID=2935737 RepID=A0A931G4J8_9MICC|nr:hypothetical protein [Arthrobacter terrae]MBG0738883.1 hypothetical protein [Arthrobacter terrae]